MAAGFKSMAAFALDFSNFMLFSVFGVKLRHIDTGAYWQERGSRGVDNYEEVDRDPYYRSLDQKILTYLQRFAQDGNAPFVEIGTYQGYRLQKYAAQIPQRQFIGADLVLPNLQVAQKQIVKSRNVALVNADAGALPFAKDSVDLVYTVVALSHVPVGHIRKAMDEIVSVARRNIVLVEIDIRPMRFREKVRAGGLPYAYAHQYEKLIHKSARLIEALPLRDENGHPRYTLFWFEKTPA
jgi:hypothetical protein